MNKKAITICFISMAFLASCASAPRFTSSKAKRSASAPKKSAPNRENKVPPSLSTTAQVGQVMTGVASYYGPNFHGQLTANGEVFDMYGVTAAHKTLPFNTVVRVTNTENGKSLLVRINDRGPYVDGRMLDLSYGAAKKLGLIGSGTARVQMKIVEIGDGEYMQH